MTHQAFRIKPTPDCKSYFSVKIEENQRELERTVKHLDLKVEGFDAVFVNNLSRKKEIGCLLFNQRNCSKNVIIHEVLHATFAYFVRKRIPFRLGNYKKFEELFATVFEYLLAQIYSKKTKRNREKRLFFAKLQFEAAWQLYKFPRKYLR